MARLWTSGFELQSNSAAVEWDSFTGTQSIDTTTKRSGAAALRCNPSAATGYAQVRFRADATTRCFIRIYLRIASAPSADTDILVYGDGTFMPLTIRLRTTRTLALYDQTTQLGSNSSALSVDTWYRIELDYDDTSVNNTAIAYLDGSQFATGNGPAVDGGGVIRVGPTDSCTADLYFDDIAVNDTSGSAQTGLPGAGSILHMQPDGAGDAAATTGLYTAIDEVTPNDATDYVEQDTNAAINYAFESFTNAGGGASDTITLVHVGTRQHPETAAASGWTPQIKSQSAGTALDGTATTHNDTTWRTNGDQTPQQPYRLTSYVDPQAGGAWTPTLLGTAIAGINVTDANPDLFVSTIWLCVEYVPNAATDHVKNLSDTVTIADSPSKKPGKVLTDSMTVAELFSNKPKLNKTDTVTIADSQVKTIVLNKTDTVILADSFARLVSFLRSIDDTVTISDLVAKATGKPIADSMGITDAILAELGRIILLSDTLDITDSERKAVGKTILDTLTLADTLAKVFGLTKSETINLVDSLTKVLGISLSDTATLSDVLVKTSGKGLSDLITASDTLAKAMGLSKSDTQTFTDTLLKVAVLNPNDTLTIVDVLNKSAAINPADTMAVIDVLSKSTTKPLSDGISFTDVIARASGKGLADTVALSDALAKGTGKPISDTMIVSDSIGKRIGKVFSDSMGIVDSIVTSIAEAFGRIYEVLGDRFKRKRGAFTSKSTLTKRKTDAADNKGDIYKKKLY